MHRAEVPLHLQNRVSYAKLPECHKYVKEDDEMWLSHIAQKTQSRAYNSVAEFKSDIQQFLKNCRAYSFQGCGQDRCEGKHFAILEACK